MQTLKLNEDSLSKDASIHILPCKIIYDGDAKVKSYFENSILPFKANTNVKNDESIKIESNFFTIKNNKNMIVIIANYIKNLALEASLRGRPLHGLKVHLQEHTTGNFNL